MLPIRQPAADSTGTTRSLEMLLDPLQIGMQFAAYYAEDSDVQALHAELLFTTAMITETPQLYWWKLQAIAALPSTSRC